MTKQINEETDSSCVEKPEMRDDEIDENLKETFPASDPPSWTLGTDHGRKSCQQEDSSPDKDAGQE